MEVGTDRADRVAEKKPTRHGFRKSELLDFPQNRRKTSRFVVEICGFAKQARSHRARLTVVYAIFEMCGIGANLTTWLQWVTMGYIVFNANHLGHR